MPADFSRTTYALEKERFKIGRFSVIALTVLAVWAGWLTLARVAVYHSTQRARIEVASSAHAVTSEVSGRVLASNLNVGRVVAAGEVLVELDSTNEKQACLEATIRRQSYIDTNRALLREINAVEESLKLESQARVAASGESDSKIVEALARHSLANTEAKISGQLREKNAVSEMEYRANLTDMQVKTAAVERERSARAKVDQDFALSSQERRVRIAQLQRQANEALASAELEGAAIARWEYAIQQRFIRAPISGVLGNVAEIHVGTVVVPAQSLATVVPSDTPRAVAFFPSKSVGLLKPDQPAVMQLDGYAWMQYGTIPSVVRNVGSEPQEGWIRVELELLPPADCAIPLAHGLPGSVDIQVELVAPATMILRGAGQYLAPRSQRGEEASVASKTILRSSRASSSIVASEFSR